MARKAIHPGEHLAEQLEALGMRARHVGAVMGHVEVETPGSFLLDYDIEEPLPQVLFSGCHSVSLRTKNPTIVATPTTMAESATLKAGQ